MNNVEYLKSKGIEVTDNMSAEYVEYLVSIVQNCYNELFNNCYAEQV